MGTIISPPPLTVPIMATAGELGRVGGSNKHASVEWSGRDRRSALRHYLHDHPRLKWFAWFGNIVMVLAAFTGVAHASPSPVGPHGLQVTELTVNQGGVLTLGQVARFTGHITGGLVYNQSTCAPVGGSPSQWCIPGIPHNELFAAGYHVYWFFGALNTSNQSRTNATEVDIAPPCSWSAQTYTQSCTANTTIQESFTYSRVGTYTVTIMVYDANFDYVFASVNVTVLSPRFHMATLTPVSTYDPNGSGPTTLYEGVPVQFTGVCLPYGSQNCSAIQYRWNFGDGQSGFGSRAYHTFAESGDYVVTLTGVDTITGAEARNFTTVLVSNFAPFGNVTQQPGSLHGPLPTAYVPYSPFTSPILGNRSATHVKVGMPVFLCTYASDLNPRDRFNLTFEWNFGDGTTALSSPHPTSSFSFLPPSCQAPVQIIHSSEGNPAQVVRESGVDTTISHVYPCAGTYSVSVSVIDEEGAMTHSSQSVTIHVQALTSPNSSAVPHYNLPVGQVALLNASDALNATDSPFYNYTWSAGTLGTTYGDVGRLSSFKPVNQTLALMSTANTTALPCCSGTPVTATSYINFHDVAPTVGLTSFYTNATITLTVEDPYYYDHLNFTLLEDGKNAGWYNMSYWVDYNTVTFKPLLFQMSNDWQVVLNYTPYGRSGGTYVDVGFNWADDNTAIDNYDATESDYSSDTVSVWFSNSNTSRENSLPISVNEQAVGEPVFGSVEFFSPAQTHLTESWYWGDGTVGHSNTSTPATPEPTMDTWDFEAAYNHGQNYTFTVRACDSWGLCGSESATIFNTNELLVSDTAPLISLNVTSTTVAYLPTTLSANLIAQNNATGPANVTWQFGDGSTVSGVGLTTVNHVFQFGSKYAVVVYANTPGGQTSVNWSFVNVLAPPPLANITVETPHPYVNNPVSFNGAFSRNSAGGTGGLNFGWLFGNGAVAGGVGSAGMMVTTTYQMASAYTVTLLVQNPEGQSSSVTKNVNVALAPIVPPYPYVPSVNATAAVAQTFNAVIPANSSFAGVPLTNVTWRWGSNNHAYNTSYGLDPVHTFLYPGQYNITVTFTGPNMGILIAYATITVRDGTPDLSLPYANTEIYGAVAPLGFTATVEGTYADANANGGHGIPWTFTWAWGDGKTSGPLSPGGNNSTATHAYNSTGPMTLNVTVSSSYWGTLGAKPVSFTAYVLDLPDSDEDGLPDAYELTTTHTNPFLVSTWDNSSAREGWGCTDYVGKDCMLVPGIGSFTGDDDSDGLTNIQEITGAVTGLYSNPLDANTAGDGIPDGAHFFSSSFSATQNVFFGPGNGSGNPALVTIPGVEYYGPTLSFNSSSLTVQVNSTGPVGLQLLTGTSRSIYLGSFGAGVYTFDLLNASPTKGAWGPYGSSLGVSDFQGQGTWYVEVIDNSGSTGTIPSATLTLSYYGDPGHADPTRQGMLQGHTLTTPILNCSAPVSSSYYQVFDPSTFTVQTIYFWPYTEAYWKLSVEQGVPYIPGTNSSLLKSNSNSVCSGWSSSLFTATATYLGDADFGISPWQPFAAGDSLTNGMKALGAANYGLTAGNYNDNGSMVPDLSGVSYPADRIASGYPGPLNPTAISTAGDNVADGIAADPVAPLGLEVNITNATDPICDPIFPSLGSNFYIPYNDIASVNLDVPSGEVSPTIYTPAVSGVSQGKCSGGNSVLLNFTFDDRYFLPVPNFQTSYQINFDLWMNDTQNPVPPDASVSLAGPFNYASIGKWVCLPSSFHITACVAVEPLQRLPLVLVNKSGDVVNLPGYGYRYVGQQDFYSVNLNLGASPVSIGTTGESLPAGSVTFLESEASLLNSTAGGMIQNNPQSLSTLGGVCGPLSQARITAVNGSGNSPGGIAGTFSADISSSPQCAVSFLQALLPLNATGKQLPLTSGEFLILNSTQVDLLGLSGGGDLLAPFNPPVGYNSPMGTPPKIVPPPSCSWDCVFVNGLNAIAGGFVAFGNLVVSLPSLLAQGGMAVINGLVSGFETAMNWLFIEGRALGQWIVQEVVNEVSAIAKPVISTLANTLHALLSLLWGLGNDTSNAWLSGAPASTVSAEWDNGLGPVASDFNSMMNDIQGVMAKIPNWVYTTFDVTSPVTNALITLIEDAFSGLGSMFSGLAGFTNTVKTYLSSMTSFSQSLLNAGSQGLFNLTASPLTSSAIGDSNFWDYMSVALSSTEFIAATIQLGVTQMENPNSVGVPVSALGVGFSAMGWVLALLSYGQDQVLPSSCTNANGWQFDSSNQTALTGVYLAFAGLFLTTVGLAIAALDAEVEITVVDAVAIAVTLLMSLVSVEILKSVNGSCG